MESPPCNSLELLKELHEVLYHGIYPPPMPILQFLRGTDLEVVQ